MVRSNCLWNCRLEVQNICSRFSLAQKRFKIVDMQFKLLANRSTGRSLVHPTNPLMRPLEQSSVLPMVRSFELTANLQSDQTDRQTERQAHRQKEEKRQTDRHTERTQIDKHTDGQTHRKKTDRQTYRRTERHGFKSITSPHVLSTNSSINPCTTSILAWFAFAILLYILA